jgi:hypothetical protein
MKQPNPIDSVKEYIKNVTETTGKCPFNVPDEMLGYHCHFVFDPECGHYGRLIGADKKREYRKCEL